MVVLGSHRVTQLLEHLSEVVEQSSLFDPQHPGLEEELESLRRRLEALSSSEPSSVETHFSNPAGRSCPAYPPLPARAGVEGQCPATLPGGSVPGRPSSDASARGAVPCPQYWWAALTPWPCSLPGSGFTLAWAAKDQGELHRFLTQNLSLPNSTAELLLGSSVDLREVGRDPRGWVGTLWEVGDSTAQQGWALREPALPQRMGTSRPRAPEPQDGSQWAPGQDSSCPATPCRVLLGRRVPVLPARSQPCSLPCCRCTACFSVPSLWYPMSSMNKTCGMGLAPVRR